MASQNDGLRRPPPWISPAAGKPNREVPQVIIVQRRGAASGYDTDAQTYITAVEAADGQSLETAVKDAINAFVVGCKADGIWSAIKASCILAGARTLTGALVPLVGTAPTSFNFVSGDYNRKTGLSSGGGKYLNSNRNNNADPQDNNHNAVYVTSATPSLSVYMGCSPGTTDSGANNMGYSSRGSLFFRNRSSSVTEYDQAGDATGLVGASRSSSANHDARFKQATVQPSSPIPSQTPFNGNVFVFSTSGGNFSTNARFAFYSIGESLTLASLDARIVTLMSAIAAAIP